MHKKLTILLFLVLVCFQFSWYENNTENIAAVPLRKWILNELHLLQTDLNGMINTSTVGQKKLYYRKARKHYKQVEFFVEHCSQNEAKFFINGPLVPKHNEEIGNTMLYPHGFQRIEELLYQQPIGDTALMADEIKLLKEHIGRIEKYYDSIEIKDGRLLEMCQLELMRMAVLTLNGYDATFSKTNIEETAWSMEGIEKVVHAFKPYTLHKGNSKVCYEQLSKQLAAAKLYLIHHPGYNNFNRLDFITHFINPANNLLVNFHQIAGLLWNNNKQALQLNNGFLFGKESFNLQFFSIYYDDTLHLEVQAEIGRLLFADPILSGNNKFSCVSCHNPSKAFTDGLSKSITIDGVRELKRNAPTLLNVIYQKAFFYDGRAYQLEQQAFDVIHNPLEMQSSLDEVAVRLKKNEQYKKLFAKAFIHTTDSSITPYAIQKSLAEYEKTLISFNSRFDQYLHGNTTSLNSREINGYNIFAGKALCGSCHFLPLFNGTVPPYFSDSEFEIIGAAENAGNKNIDSDEGRYAVTKIPEQRYAFKTPTLRNISLTAPYMHNGAYNSLEEVIEFYHRGGGKGFGFIVPNQTLPFDSLQLSAKEKEDINLFLQTLTDTASYKK